MREHHVPPLYSCLNKDLSEYFICNFLKPLLKFKVIAFWDREIEKASFFAPPRVFYVYRIKIIAFFTPSLKLLFSPFLSPHPVYTFQWLIQEIITMRNVANNGNGDFNYFNMFFSSPFFRLRNHNGRKKGGGGI